MKYQVVFDASQKGYEWWWLLIWIAILAVLVASWRRTQKLPSEGERAAQTLILFFALAFGSCFGIVAFIGSYSTYDHAQQVFRSGNTQVVEGVVKDFVPPPPYYSSESFAVNGIKFEYGTGEITPGFNQTSTHGGPINRNGLQVRIHYYIDPSTSRNVILRLEVRSN